MSVFPILFRCIGYIIGILIVVAIFLMEKITFSKYTKRERKEHANNKLKLVEIIILNLIVVACVAQISFYSYCAINPDIESFEGVYIGETRGYTDPKRGKIYCFSTGYGTREIWFAGLQYRIVMDGQFEEGQKYRIFYEELSGEPLKIEKIGG